MAKAKKLPSGTWSIQIYIGSDKDGKRKYKRFSATTKKEAELAAAQYLNEHPNYKDSDDMSFEAAMEHFLRIRKHVLSPATLRGYDSISRELKRRYSAFCNTKLIDIDSDCIQDLINDLIEYGSSPKTISNWCGFISACLKEKNKKMPDVKLPAKQKPELTIPDTEDVKRIIKQAEGTELEIPVLLAAYGPLRRSEIIGLSLDDIHGNVAHVHSAVVLDTHLVPQQKGTKTYDSDRYIPLPDNVIRKIREKGCITTLTNPHHITQRFEHLVKQAGCPDVRFHDLRHWCCSWLHSQGVPDQYIMARGGWKTDHVMKTVYRHALTSETDAWNKSILSGFEKLSL